MSDKRTCSLQIGYPLTGRSVFRLIHQARTLPLEEVAQVDVDLGGVPVDASGIVMLTRLFTHLRARHKRLRLVQVDPDVRRKLEAARLTDLWPVVAANRDAGPRAA